MPQIKSAIKRVKTQEAARVRNIAQMNAMRSRPQPNKMLTTVRIFTRLLPVLSIWQTAKA